MIEDLVGETAHQAPRLPHSSTVGATAQLLSELAGFVAARKGFSVPVTSMKLSAPNASAVHSECSASLLQQPSLLDMPWARPWHCLWRLCSFEEIRPLRHLISYRVRIGIA